MCSFPPVACENELLLSENRNLLGSIEATSSSSDDPPKDLVDSEGNAWCSTEEFKADSPAPYIQLNFTQPVFLTHMRARGETNGFSYVTAFQLEMLDDDGYYIPYKVSHSMRTTVSIYTTSRTGLSSLSIMLAPPGLEGLVRMSHKLISADIYDR